VDTKPAPLKTKDSALAQGTQPQHKTVIPTGVPRLFAARSGGIVATPRINFLPMETSNTATYPAYIFLARIDPVFSFSG
jgi:hypothetical protein